MNKKEKLKEVTNRLESVLAMGSAALRDEGYIPTKNDMELILDRLEESVNRLIEITTLEAA
jgi:hypothetical protein